MPRKFRYDLNVSSKKRAAAYKRKSHVRHNIKFSKTVYELDCNAIKILFIVMETICWFILSILNIEWFFSMKSSFYDNLGRLTHPTVIEIKNQSINKVFLRLFYSFLGFSSIISSNRIILIVQLLIHHSIIVLYME